MRIMNENVMLIKEINDLRREIRVLKQKAGSGDAAAAGPGAKKGGGKRVQSGGRPLPPSLDEAGREIEMQKAEIARLQVRGAPYPTFRLFVCLCGALGGGLARRVLPPQFESKRREKTPRVVAFRAVVSE